MGFDIQQTLLWIVLLPLFGAVINGVAGRSAAKQVVAGVAVGSVALAFGLSLVGFAFLFAHAGDPTRQKIVFDFYEWFRIDVDGAEVPVRVRFVMDHLSGIMAVMVTGIAALIHVYSIGYMKEDPGFARFMAYLNLFTASMLVLTLASNFVLMFVGWEGVGLCSYLLIGFWFTNADYAAAGRKAFVVNRIGDFGVLIGMFLLLAAVAPNRDAFEFTAINEVARNGGLTSTVTVGTFSLDTSVATLATLFLFLGVCGKSAQFPLYVWLPDAMAGPTPVSALIHAATMVTAGVYLLCRLSPVVVESPYAMAFIAIVGAFTALLAASIALAQNEMKKILAYSTVSQLGFMVAACGMGAFAAGFFHVFTHAFFKACLFLGAGSVMHAVRSHGDADIRYLGGLKDKLPKTHVTFAIATAAISGLPLMSGFFSKDEILLGALTWATGMPYGPWVGWLVFAALVVAATMTAFYMFRLYFLTFWGDYKGGHPPPEADEGHADQPAHGPVEPHESPSTMTVPLYVLAAGAVVVGLFGLPHAWGAPNLWAQWLTPGHEAFLETLHEAGEGVSREDLVRQATAAGLDTPSVIASLQLRGPTVTDVEMIHAPGWVPWLALILGTLAFLIGAGLAYVWYVQQGGKTPAALAERAPGLHRLLQDKWRVDEAYGKVLVTPMKWLAVLAANLDRFFVDLVLTRLTSVLAKTSGYVLTRAQNGVLFAYAGLFVAGFAVLGWWFTYPHGHLEGEARGATVTWTASRGLGYEYRWDLDSDGSLDEVVEGTPAAAWTEEPTATWRVEATEGARQGSAFYALVAIFQAPRQQQFGPEEIELWPGDGAVEVPVDQLGDAWARAIQTGGSDGDFRGASVPPTLRYQDGQVLVQINGADLVDRDGGDDGRFLLAPGESIDLAGGRITVAILVRGTVEIRNPFSNRTVETAEVVVEVPRPRDAPQAQVLR